MTEVNLVQDHKLSTFKKNIGKDYMGCWNSNEGAVMVCYGEEEAEPKVSVFWYKF